MLQTHVLPNLFTAALLAAPLLASAQQTPPPQLEERPQARESMQNRRSLSDAVRRVERTTRGEVLSAERIQYDGRDMHRVKVLDQQGRVRVFMQEPSRAGAQRPRERDDN